MTSNLRFTTCKVGAQSVETTAPSPSNGLWIFSFCLFKCNARAIGMETRITFQFHEKWERRAGHQHQSLFYNVEIYQREVLFFFIFSLIYIEPIPPHQFRNVPTNYSPPLLLQMIWKLKLLERWRQLRLSPMESALPKVFCFHLALELSW